MTRFVGIDPDGVAGLAATIDQYAARLDILGGGVAGLSDGSDAGTSVARISTSLAEYARDLRRRASVIEITLALPRSRPLFRSSPFWSLSFAAHGPAAVEREGEWCDSRWLSLLTRLPPADVAVAFGEIAAAARPGLVDSYPELIGSLDGAPLTMRIDANRILIQAEIDQINLVLDKLDQTEVRRSGVVARTLGERSAEWERWLEEDRQILLFDPSGDGRVAEMFGDPAAQQLAVAVPGMANDIDNFSLSSGGFRREALALHAATHQQVATIAWLGYDTPDGVDAVSRSAAESAAPRLRRFVAGLAGGGDRTTITVIAHSYGTVVAGLAAVDGIEADNLVFVGSPGTTLDHADQAILRNEGRVWAGLADGDPIAVGIDPMPTLRWWEVLSPVGPVLGFTENLISRSELWHGANPVSTEFGATVIGTAGSSGHSDYFEQGSLANLARIASGAYADVELVK